MYAGIIKDQCTDAADAQHTYRSERVVQLCTTKRVHFVCLYTQFVLGVQLNRELKS